MKIAIVAIENIPDDPEAASKGGFDPILWQLNGVAN